MSKYGDVIRQARKSEENGIKPEDQKDGKPENQKHGKPDINQEAGTKLDTGEGTTIAIETQSQQKSATRLEAQAQEAQAQEKPEEVNLSIKVTKKLRRHWVSEAKRHDTTLTAVIIEALKARFGEPPEV